MFAVMLTVPKRSANQKSMSSGASGPLAATDAAAGAEAGASAAGGAWITAWANVAGALAAAGAFACASLAMYFIASSSFP